MSIAAVAGIAALADTLIKKIWPDPAKQAEELRKLEEIRQRGDLAELQAYTSILAGQLEINKEEAKHPSILVAGWRPFVGWVCGGAFAWKYIMFPIVTWVMGLFGVVSTSPVVNTSELMPLLLAMLGIGGYRTYEKLKQVDTKKIDKSDN